MHTFTILFWFFTSSQYLNTIELRSFYSFLLSSQLLLPTFILFLTSASISHKYFSLNEKSHTSTAVNCINGKFTMLDIVFVRLKVCQRDFFCIFAALCRILSLFFMFYFFYFWRKLNHTDMSIDFNNSAHKFYDLWFTFIYMVIVLHNLFMDLLPIFALFVSIFISFLYLWISVDASSSIPKVNISIFLLQIFRFNIYWFLLLFNFNLLCIYLFFLTFDFLFFLVFSVPPLRTSAAYLIAL